MFSQIHVRRLPGASAGQVTGVPSQLSPETTTLKQAINTMKQTSILRRKFFRFCTAALNRRIVALSCVAGDGPDQRHGVSNQLLTVERRKSNQPAL